MKKGTVTFLLLKTARRTGETVYQREVAQCRCCPYYQDTLMAEPVTEALWRSRVSSMDRKQPLLKALAEAPDEANADDVLMQLFDLFRIEKGIAATEDVTPRKARYCMGKWLKEPYYFEMFRRHYHYLLPTGRIEYRDKPDFILHGSKKDWNRNHTLLLGRRKSY